jgi:metal-responsive CopG/Arc/MetJ family transcriptional regulator
MAKAKKKTGPAIGPEGRAKIICVSVPTELAAKLDAHCEQNETGRSAVVVEAIRSLLGRAATRRGKG